MIRTGDRRSAGDRYPTAEGPLGDLRALRNQTMTTTVRTQPDRPVLRSHPWIWAAVGLGAFYAEWFVRL